MLGAPAPSPLGRLAPSPTGELHLGHARSFLLAYWNARRHGARLLLRLEDLDTDRARSEYADLCRKDLEWLGLDWDLERVQSHGLERLRQTAFELMARGLAYPCTCSRGDVNAAVSAPHGGEAGRYPGTCRERGWDLTTAEARTGKLAGLRFRTEDRSFSVADGCAGPHTENLYRESGDFLILRRDKVPAYHLAVVVDDALDGVTEVVRGDDLLPSTPKHLALYEALGAPPPRYFHVPLVVDDTGRRLAKRARDLSLQRLREGGVDPRRVVQWAAESAGMDAPELLGASELVPLFEMGRVPRTSVVLDARALALLGC